MFNERDFDIRVCEPHYVCNHGAYGFKMQAPTTFFIPYFVVVPRFFESVLCLPIAKEDVTHNKIIRRLY